MKICICGSMSFIDEMEAMGAILLGKGHGVTTPEREERERRWETLPLDEAVRLKAGYVGGYLEVIRQTDLVLIANYDKSGVAGYVGANALVEAAFAFALGKPVVFLNAPGVQPCQLEALALMGACLGGDLSRLVA